MTGYAKTVGADPRRHVSAEWIPALSAGGPPIPYACWRLLVIEGWRRS